MRETEQKLLASEKYKTKLCLLKSSGDCQKPRSVLRFFDGTYEGFNVNDSATGLNIFRIDANFERISQIIGTAWEADGTVVDAGNIKNAGNPNIKVILQYNLGKGGFLYINTILCVSCTSISINRLYNQY